MLVRLTAGNRQAAAEGIHTVGAIVQEPAVCQGQGTIRSHQTAADTFFDNITIFTFNLTGGCVAIEQGVIDRHVRIHGIQTTAAVTNIADKEAIDIVHDRGFDISRTAQSRCCIAAEFTIVKIQLQRRIGIRDQVVVGIDRTTVGLGTVRVKQTVFNRYIGERIDRTAAVAGRVTVEAAICYPNILRVTH